jgi:hypothetical protein
LRAATRARIIAALLCPVAASCVGDSGQTSAELLSSYERGYGDAEDFSITTLSARVAHTSDRARLSLTVPYRIVRAPDVVVTTGPPWGRGTFEGDSDGIGDLELDGEFYVWGDTSKGWYGGPRVGVRYDTGDEDDGLGTGGPGFSIGIHGGVTDGTVTHFGRAVHTFNVDPPGGELRDTWSFVLGIAVTAGDDDTFIIHAESVDPVTPGEPEAVSLRLSWTRRFGGSWWLTVSPSAGFSSTAADFGLTLSVGVSGSRRRWLGE